MLLRTHASILLVSGLLAFSASAGAQLKLLRDINAQRPENPSGNPGRLTRLGSWFYCAAELPATGRELFRVHAVTGAAELVRDLRPGWESSKPRSIVARGNSLFFVARDGSGAELWTSDGTAAGTAPVTKSRLVISDELVVLGGRVFFAGDDGKNGNQLWASDGTAAGTVMLTSVANGAHPQKLLPWNDRLLFDAVDPKHGREPWISDGTPAGTKLIKDLDGATRSSLGDHRRDVPTPFGSVVAFIASPAFGTAELWVTDGSSRGTRRVRTFPTNTSEPARVLGVHRGRLYLAAEAPGQGQELWTSDGTTAGTTLLADLNSQGSSSPGHITSFGGLAYFAATDAKAGRTLFRTNGTAAGTQRMPAFANAAIGPPKQIVTTGGTLFFEVDKGATHELWATDGSQQSTFVRRSFLLSDRTGLGELQVWKPGWVVFSAWDRIQDRELWIADPSGRTRLWSEVAAPRGTGDSGAYLFMERAGTTFFVADDGIHGKELWASDGTSAGTRLVKDLRRGSEDSWPYGLTPVAGRVFFAADTQPDRARELWMTDGTGAGTVRVPGAPRFKCCVGPQYLTAFRGKLFFFSFDSDKGSGLWCADGTPGGTREVARLGSASGAVWPPGIAGDRLFFYWSGRQGRGVWVSDGTKRGTKLLLPRMIASGFHGWRGRAFFANRTTLDATLWISDGTVAGSRQLHPNVRNPRGFVAGTGALYFFATDKVYATALWRTDGTTAGTRRVFGFGPTLVPAARRFGDSVLIAASTVATGRELWISDGTSNGTRLVADVRPGPGDGVLGDLHVVGSRKAFFLGADAVHGQELWRSDGTPNGTRIVQDLRPGQLSSTRHPQWRIGYGAGRVHLLADDGKTGDEVWTLAPGAVATVSGQPCGPTRPRLGASDPALGSAMTVRIEQAPLGSVALLQLGVPARAPVALGLGCSVYVDLRGPTVLLDARLAVRSEWRVDLRVPPDAALAGVHAVTQGWFLATRPAGPFGFTNAVDLRLGR